MVVGWGLLAWFKRMAEPHADVKDEAVRRRVKLILAVTLIGIPLEILDVATAPFTSAPQGLDPLVQTVLSTFTFVSIIATYLVARSRRAELSFPLFVLLLTLVSWFYVYQGVGRPFHDAMLAFPPFVIVLAGLFGGIPLIATATVVNAVLVFLEPASHGPDWYSRWTFVSIYLLTGGFLVIAAFMRSNDTKTIRQRTLDAQQSEERFRILAQSASEGLLIHENGTILDSNEAASRLLGYTPSEFRQMRILDLTAPASRAKVTQVIRENQDSTYETELVRKDGSVLTVETHSRPLPFGGRTVRVAAVRDVSAERAIRAKLEQASRDAEAASAAKSNFLATMSHELRTPLNAVLGYAQLLEEEHPEGKNRDMLTTMRSSAEHLLSIVSNILDFTKSEGGAVALDPKPTDLAAQVRQALEGQVADANAKGLRLECFIPEPAAPLVLADATRLQQILRVLLSNAIKFTQTGQVDVQLGWEADGAQVHVTVLVRDTGSGIRQEILQTLFNPFSQADSSMTRAHGGVGIGLALARRLAMAMGGDVQLTSQPGVGTIATVRLHLKACGPGSGTAMAPIAPAPANARILVAEDDPVNQKVIARMLERLGHKAHIVPDGRQAVEAAAHHPFDLILMDLHMPVMDGLEATRRLRAAGNRIQIVALTADALVGDREKCLAAGMDNYLSKPVRLDQLKDALKGAVSAPN